MISTFINFIQRLPTNILPSFQSYL